MTTASGTTASRSRGSGRRFRPYLLGLPAVGLLIAGGAACAPFHAGAAAVVGSDRISTTQLRGIVDRGVAAEPKATASAPASSRAAVTTQALTDLIQLKILQKMAAQQHVVVNSQDIAAALAALEKQTAGLVASAAAQGIAESDLSTFAARNAYVSKVSGALPVSDSAIAAAYQANLSSFQEVQISGILVQTTAEANEVAADAKAKGANFAALAMALSGDSTTASKGGDFGYVGLSDVGSIAPTAATAPVGTIVISSQTQSGYYVFKVGAHRTLTLQEATAQLRASLQSTEFATDYAKVEAALHISVSPRFGIWDPKGDTNSGLGAVTALPQSDDLSVPVSASPSPSASQ